MVKYKVKITDIIEEAHGTKTFILDKPEDFTWLEGAHTHIGMLGFDEGETPNKAWVRHMSIITLPEDNKIGFTTRVYPPFSEFKDKLSGLQAGDEVVLFKIGSRMYLRREEKTVVLVSMGVGIATMRPLIKSFIKDQTGIRELISLNIDSSGDFIYKAELDQLHNPKLKKYFAENRNEFYEILNVISENKDAYYYLVGSDNFLRDIIKYLKNKNIPEKSILLDKKEELLADYFS
ncbi:FAD-dependent oxidoreductase [Clostridium sp. KNHs205]|jgi:ferredoxin-NADP reductase|uniref:FAD-dependent oxidoreductase n=1 Tax=Clostridium sp. KNHs205 TaxID=1449050 RepID=UPI00051BB658|nr:FAD-dependent oxidoreductase [Clostridium sp. KNHs205]